MAKRYLCQSLKSKTASTHIPITILRASNKCNLLNTIYYYITILKRVTTKHLMRKKNLQINDVFYNDQMIYRTTYFATQYELLYYNIIRIVISNHCYSFVSIYFLLVDFGWIYFNTLGKKHFVIFKYYKYLSTSN